jgi:thiamine biosynthesis lipoprotein
MDRKRFLQVLVTGGLGAVFAQPVLGKSIHWLDRGINLTSVQRQSLVMGSIISFDVVAEREADAYEAIRRAERVFRSLEKTFSMYDPESEMALLAQRSGSQVTKVSPEAQELLTFAQNMTRQTRGRFDITVEPAMRRWGFRSNPNEEVTPPTDEELKTLERTIGSDKMVIDDNRVLLQQQGMALDTGGIAGGYALDQAISTMKECDIAAAFINFSGDIHCFGQPLEGRGWPVHILDPYTREPLRDAITLNNEALSTSGAYQNRRHDQSEHSWGHLLLPGEAQPVEPVGSFTAIHPSALQADAWSTAGYVGAAPPEAVRTFVIS